MKWFGEDGRLLALPDPVIEISSRPPVLDDEGPALTTPYKHVCISLYRIVSPEISWKFPPENFRKFIPIFLEISGKFPEILTENFRKF